MEAWLRDILADVPALCDREAMAEPLSGGLTNSNYRVQAGGNTYVLRLFGAGTEWLGIDRDQEVLCSRAAAAADVGPEVIAYLPGHRALLTRFVAGRLLTAADARRPDTLGRVADTLRRCHGHPAPFGLVHFSPFATVRAYHARAVTRKVPLPPEVDEAMRILAKLEELPGTGEALSLCHNDLVAANLIDDGAAVRIVDWEYGGLGDRFFDLGNFAVNLRLGEDDECTLLTAYFGEARPEHLHRLRLMRLVSDLRESMWGYLQAGLSTLHSPEYYLEYGREHLERFLAAGRRARNWSD